MAAQNCLTDGQDSPLSSRPTYVIQIEANDIDNLLPFIEGGAYVGEVPSYKGLTRDTQRDAANVTQKTPQATEKG